MSATKIVSEWLTAPWGSSERRELSARYDRCGEICLVTAQDGTPMKVLGLHPRHGTLTVKVGSVTLDILPDDATDPRPL